MEKGLRFFIWGNWSDYGHLVNIYLFLGHLSLFDNLLSPVRSCVVHLQFHILNFILKAFSVHYMPVAIHCIHVVCIMYETVNITKDWPASLFLPKVYNFPP